MVNFKHQYSFLRWLQYFGKQFLSKNTNHDTLVEEGQSIVNMALKWHDIDRNGIGNTLQKTTTTKLLCSGNEKVTTVQDNEQKSYKAENEEFFYNMLQETSAVYSIRGIISLIESMPLEVMTSKFCTYAIVNLLNLEANRFTGLFLSLDPHHIRKQERIMHQLVDRLVMIGEPADLMHVSLVLLNDHRPFETQDLAKKCLTQIHKDITNGVFSFRQILQTMILLSNNVKKTTDISPVLRSMWVGLQLTEDQIDRENLLGLFECLELVPECSAFLIALIDRLILMKPIQLQTGDVMKILKAVNRTELYSPNFNKFVSRWVLENINTIDKTELSDLLLFYNKEQKHDSHLEEALELYLQTHANEALEYSFIFRRIAQYLTKRKIFNKRIMETYGNILKAHVNDLKPVVVRDIFHLFGTLGEKIPADVKTVMDNYIEKNFYIIPSYVVTSLLFTNALANNYNPKIIPLVLDSRFQKLAKSCYSQSITQLLTYDQGMRFEFPNYKSPFLTFETTTHFASVETSKVTQVLITDVESQVKEILEEIGYSYQKFVALDFMPKLDIFIVDIIAYPKTVPLENKPIEEFVNMNKGKILAILIQRTDDCVRGTDQHSGIQRLRMNFFDHLGIKCVYLREDLIQQYKNYPNRFKAYIRNAIEIGRQQK